MDLGIKGKVGLVTGASAGLGFEAALALATEGVKVAINSRSDERLAKAARKIKDSTGYLPTSFSGDLAAKGAAEKLVEDVKQKMGPIEILVSNAGGPPGGPFANHSKETWRESADLTLFSAINLAREVIPDMVEKKWGRIVFITSIAVKQPVDGLIISNTLRAGLTGFAKTISNEYAKFGITINTVCPGYTRTDRLNELAETKSKSMGISQDDIFQGWIDSIPAGRLGQPNELAALIAFLSSEKAAYITGTAITVDGGCHKGLI